MIVEQYSAYREHYEPNLWVNVNKSHSVCPDIVCKTCKFNFQNCNLYKLTDEEMDEIKQVFPEDFV